MKKWNWKWFRRVVLLLLIAVQMVTGCDQENSYQCGDWTYTLTPHTIMMGIKSDTDTFMRNAVRFDLYYGVYDILYHNEYKLDPKTGYLREGCEDVFFSLYISNKKDPYQLYNDMRVQNHTEMEGYQHLFDLTSEDAFSEQYGFSMDYSGISYRHREELCIPEDFFSEVSGTIIVQLVAFAIPVDGSDYCITHTDAITLNYQTVEINSIKISFT